MPHHPSEEPVVQGPYAFEGSESRETPKGKGGLVSESSVSGDVLRGQALDGKRSLARLLDSTRKKKDRPEEKRGVYLVSGKITMPRSREKKKKRSTPSGEREA